MALRPTAISYKETEEDRILRDWIHSHSNVSGFIKDILRSAMNGGCASNTQVTTKKIYENNNDDNDLIDF